jgi:hypothetical protein
MSVRRRRWKTGQGEQKGSWIVDYVDQEGDRHIETFCRKKDADAYMTQCGRMSAKACILPRARA